MTRRFMHCQIHRLLHIISSSVLIGVLMFGVVPATLAQTPSPNSTVDQQSAPDVFDEAAEKQLVDLLEQDRKKAGLAPVEWNMSLRDTAHMHAVELTKHTEMAAEFPGELDLTHRLALSNVRIAAAAEVMAESSSLEHAHDYWAANPTTYSHAMSSKYTDIGVAALKHNGRYYFVIDLVEALSKIGVDELEAVVVKAVQDYRVQRKIMPLTLADTKRLRRVACDMAKSGSLAKQQIDPSLLETGGHIRNGDAQVISFTVIQPADLPASITRLAADPTITTFAVGGCIGQNSYYVSTVFYYNIKPATGR